MVWWWAWAMMMVGVKLGVVGVRHKYPASIDACPHTGLLIMPETRHLLHAKRHGTEKTARSTSSRAAAAICTWATCVSAKRRTRMYSACNAWTFCSYLPAHANPAARARGRASRAGPRVRDRAEPLNRATLVEPALPKRGSRRTLL